MYRARVQVAVVSLLVLVWLDISLCQFRNASNVFSHLKGLNLNLPKWTPKPFTWKGNVLHNNGRPNGFSGTGTWNPRGTGNSFSGTARWQKGKGFMGGVSGSVGVGRGVSIFFGGSAGGGSPSGRVGLRLNFGSPERGLDLTCEMFIGMKLFA